MIIYNFVSILYSRYAIGDVMLNVPELTPVAIKAGELLAQRLFGGSAVLMDYERVCTTVFTPVEYGCCGLTEEAAKTRFGDDGIEVYHSTFRPLESSLHGTEEGYCKAICALHDNHRIIGLHYFGPHAGEVLQGFGVAMKMGLTLQDLQSTVGIHPTTAEALVKLKITKSSGIELSSIGC